MRGESKANEWGQPGSLLCVSTLYAGPKTIAPAYETGGCHRYVMNGDIDPFSASLSTVASGTKVGPHKASPRKRSTMRPIGRRFGRPGRSVWHDGADAVPGPPPGFADMLKAESGVLTNPKRSGSQRVRSRRYDRRWRSRRRQKTDAAFIAARTISMEVTIPKRKIPAPKRC